MRERLAALCCCCCGCAAACVPKQPLHAAACCLMETCWCCGFGSLAGAAACLLFVVAADRSQDVPGTAWQDEGSFFFLFFLLFFLFFFFIFFLITHNAVNFSKQQFSPSRTIFRGFVTRGFWRFDRRVAVGAEEAPPSAPSTTILTAFFLFYYYATPLHIPHAASCQPTPRQHPVLKLCDARLCGRHHRPGIAAGQEGASTSSLVSVACGRRVCQGPAGCAAVAVAAPRHQVSECRHAHPWADNHHMQPQPLPAACTVDGGQVVAEHLDAILQQHVYTEAHPGIWSAATVSCTRRQPQVRDHDCRMLRTTTTVNDSQTNSPVLGCFRRPGC